MSRAQSSRPLKSNALTTPVPVMTHTLRPSVTGDGDDMFCLRILKLPPPSSPFQTTAPLARPTAHSCSLSPSAVFRNIRSPQTTGVDPENSGIGSVQASPSLLDHFTGSPRSALT